MVNQALRLSPWVGKIKMGYNFTMQHCHNSSTIGFKYKTCNFGMRFKMGLRGSSWQVDNTQPSRPMRWNSLVPSPPCYTKPSRKLGSPGRPNSSHGF
jgi:hypothetical protein